MPSICQPYHIYLSTPLFFFQGLFQIFKIQWFFTCHNLAIVANGGFPSSSGTYLAHRWCWSGNPAFFQATSSSRFGQRFGYSTCNHKYLERNDMPRFLEPPQTWEHSQNNGCRPKVETSFVSGRVGFLPKTIERWLTEFLSRFKNYLKLAAATNWDQEPSCGVNISSISVIVHILLICPYSFW